MNDVGETTGVLPTVTVVAADEPTGLEATTETVSDPADEPAVAVNTPAVDTLHPVAPGARLHEHPVLGQLEAASWYVVPAARLPLYENVVDVTTGAGGRVTTTVMGLENAKLPPATTLTEALVTPDGGVSTPVLVSDDALQPDGGPLGPQDHMQPLVGQPDAINWPDAPGKI